MIFLEDSSPVHRTSVYTIALSEGIDEASLRTPGTALRLQMRTEAPPWVTALTTASTPRVAYLPRVTKGGEMGRADQGR